MWLTYQLGISVMKEWVHLLSVFRVLFYYSNLLSMSSMSVLLCYDTLSLLLPGETWTGSKSTDGKWLILYSVYWTRSRRNLLKAAQSQSKTWCCVTSTHLVLLLSEWSVLSVLKPEFTPYKTTMKGHWLGKNMCSNWTGSNGPVSELQNVSQHKQIPENGSPQLSGDI